MEKEDSKVALKSIKEKVRDWSSRHFLAARCSVYPFLLVLWFVSFIPAFRWFNLFNTEATSARYMLSALVQSQAAIVAIVVSLTLVAVQLTASAYSPRVIDVFKSFKKNPDFWILLGFYGFSIFYGLFILKLVKATEGEFVNQSAIWPSFHPILSLEHGVSIAYWLGTFTFIILVPYLWNILDLLKPENIINRLTVEITKENLLNSEEDPIQPIMDIVHGSIMKYDIETTRVGLDAVEQITKIIIKIIDLYREVEISERFCGHLKRVGRLAASRADEESTEEVITILEIFGQSTAEKRLENATAQAAWALKDVGKTAAEKGLELTTWQAAKSLGVVGKSAAKNGLDYATPQIAKALEDVGKVAALKGLELATLEAAQSLRTIIENAAAVKRLRDTVWQATESLVAVGKAAAAKKGLEDATRQIAWSLVEWTISSEELVKSVIRVYKSGLEEQDRGSFQEFMKIYEQKLEELRAEKRNAE